jgi:hypothetical protein
MMWLAKQKMERPTTETDSLVVARLLAKCGENRSST